MQLTFREAVHEDVSTLVQMLADDVLGATREDSSQPANPRYLAAFAAIQYDPNNLLIVAECDGEIVGMLQLTFIPYLTHIGSWRCLIEGVRVHAAHRGRGIGRQLLQWAIDLAMAKETCNIVQLTSDKQRPDALRFYKSLGFEATHEGFKRKLDRA